MVEVRFLLFPVFLDASLTADVLTIVASSLVYMLLVRLHSAVTVIVTVTVDPSTRPGPLVFRVPLFRV